MLSVGVGPLSLSIGHLLLVLAFVVALIVGALTGRKEKTPVAGTLADIFLVAMVSARIGFVVRYFGEYQGDWLGMIDIRDGGFDMVTGLVVALAFTGYLMWKRAAMRRALGSAVAAGLITWGGISGLIALMNQQTQGLPEVALTDLNERPVDLASLGGDKPTVVNLWATWCPPCIREMPVLEEAQQRYPNVNFVFANQGEHPETIRKFLMEQNLNLSHVLSDRQNRFGRVVGSYGLPTTLFYNAQGHLVDTHMGELSRASLARSLERFDASFLNSSPSKELTSR
ncbi:TlpA disulfide reductase family protein [Marinobacter vinifirmus]|uniref:Redoxin domain-containing protein n=1 Tax=Marinobacter vinifirmus TaxID=355591 RepID=A0A558B4M9_9GAMM|nr:TlpA disulfide reductase family protein [Marinobacter vinifirmus]TVT31467.1 MAG: redoxin domain-containing protein [Marinobacter vinifirmus]